MKLLVTTPTAIVVNIDGVHYLRAEDRTGAFGIAQGHADFLTLLPVSVVTWKGAGSGEGFVLVRNGVLSVRGGDCVEIAARGAHKQEELLALGEEALEALRREDESEDIARTGDTRLHLATMRQIERVLTSGSSARSEPPLLDGRRAEEAAG